MGVLSYALTLDTSRFNGGLRSSSGLLSSFAGGATKAAGTVAGLLSPLAALLTPLAAAGAAFKAIKAGADFESTQTSFATLLGSMDAARDLLGDIKKEAESTPFSFNELTGAARSLLSVSGKDNVVRDMRMIGDLASAAQKPVGELAQLYAKIKGGDIVQGEDLNQIGDALGVKALEEFVKVLGVDSVKAVRKLGAEGKISGAFLEQVFINLTSQGGLAFGAMDAQSRTTNGLFSTLKDSLASLFLTIGTPINDFLKPILTGAIARVQIFGIQLQGVIGLLQASGKENKLGELVGSGLQLAAIKFINTFAGGVRGSVAFLAAALPEVLTGAKDILFGSGVAESIISTFEAVGNFLERSLLRGAAAIAGAAGLGGTAQTLNKEANEAGKAGNIALATAKSIMANLDGAGIGAKVAETLSDALEDGGAAYTKAASKDLINEKSAVDGFKEVAGTLKDAGDALEMVLNPRNFIPEASEAAPGTRKADGIDAPIAALSGEQKKAAEATKKNTAALEKKSSAQAEDSGKKTIKLFNGFDSIARRFNRQSAADRGDDTLIDYVNKSSATRAELNKYADEKGITFQEAISQLSKLITPAKPGKDDSALIAAGEAWSQNMVNANGAIKNLSPAAAAADPQRGRRGAGSDPAAKQSASLLSEVKSINEKFGNLAVA